MKKWLLTGLLSLLCFTSAQAQSDDPGCHFGASVSDTNCVARTTCTTATQCPRTQFTVRCAGTIRFKALTVAADGTNCAHCAACVTVTTLGGAPLLTFDTSAECNTTACCDTSSLSMSAGNYYMYVCLVRCNDVDNKPCCTDGHGFSAWAFVSDQPLSCQ
ncbi:MAG: hypothetical protein IPG71_02065 [bacterium]|nr:hypothetical protein [bacterium]